MSSTLRFYDWASSTSSILISKLRKLKDKAERRSFPLLYIFPSSVSRMTFRSLFLVLVRYRLGFITSIFFSIYLKLQEIPGRFSAYGSWKYQSSFPGITLFFLKCFLLSLLRYISLSHLPGADMIRYCVLQFFCYRRWCRVYYFTVITEF